MKKIELDGFTFTGYSIPTTNVTMLVISAPKGGMLACGYISRETADKFGDVLATVRGVNSFDDVLSANVCDVSQEAKKLGISIGMTGREALAKML